MDKPESYPFLKIAKQYHVEYSIVLTVADWYRKRDNPFSIAIPNNVLECVDNMPASCLRDIRLAYDQQELIRRGIIDWQTGEDTRL